MKTQVFSTKSRFPAGTILFLRPCYKRIFFNTFDVEFSTSTNGTVSYYAHSFETHTFKFIVNKDNMRVTFIEAFIDKNDMIFWKILTSKGPRFICGEDINALPVLVES